MKLMEQFEKETGYKRTDVGYAEYVEWLEAKFTSHNSDYAKCEEEINTYCDNHPLWVMDDVFNIIKKHFA